MSVKLLTEHHLVFQSLEGGCTGSSESTLVKMPHCWKSHVMAHFFLYLDTVLNKHHISVRFDLISNIIQYWLFRHLYSKLFYYITSLNKKQRQQQQQNLDHELCLGKS